MDSPGFKHYNSAYFAMQSSMDGSPADCQGGEAGATGEDAGRSGTRHGGVPRAAGGRTRLRWDRGGGSSANSTGLLGRDCLPVT